MTSFAFIMGVLPLVFASGAGAEVRHVMGVTVFARHARRDASSACS
jgi:multidrug efflux pump